MYAKYLKRILDVFISLTAVIVLSPVLLVLSVLVKVKLGSPVLFRQERPGKDEKIFTLCKFRTMTDARDKNGDLLPDSERLTAFGKMLRSTSLDELPELFNILRGDMSLIGPRPLLVKYLPLYNDFQKHRHDVKPGLTGWAQVNGRNAISWEQRFELDVYYVNNLSFRLDLKILFLTAAVVFRRSGISSATDATMEAFTGTKPETGQNKERTELRE
ncbi:MAG: sugar transferase [Blautia sp.]|nr:sugar transferase [Blautia sp.]MCM1200889.1 sugar transferase [Bacteroides fragilis]